AVDLDVNLARVFRVSAQISGDAIIEAHAYGNQEIGLLDGIVYPGFAVHAHHSEVQRIFGREAADAEQGHGYRIISGAHELLKSFHRTGNDNSVPGENQRA